MPKQFNDPAIADNTAPAATQMMMSQSASGGNAFERVQVGDLLKGSILTVSVSAGLVASTTQAQGELPLGSTVSVVATVANANDAATLPAAAAGRVVLIFNDGANALQVFPASGDAVGAGAVDASVTVAAGGRAVFVAEDGTTWRRADLA